MISACGLFGEGAESMPEGYAVRFGKLQRRTGRSVRDEQMRILRLRITCFRENLILREFCDAVLCQ